MEARLFKASMKPARFSAWLKQDLVGPGSVSANSLLHPKCQVQVFIPTKNPCAWPICTLF
jgi:hypothetical protein